MSTFDAWRTFLMLGLVLALMGERWRWRQHPAPRARRKLPRGWPWV